MINRADGKYEHGIAVTNKVFTCSTGDVASGAAINGRVVDRLGLGGGRIFEYCQSGISVHTTVGSTAGDKRVTLSIKLQHGDSSGGGDMADYSTGMQNADQNFFTTAESTAYQNWTTGVMHLSHQSWYNVVPAKRYVRPVGVFTRGGVTTSTAAGSVDYMWADLHLNFSKVDYAPPLLSTSTSTSTST
jgi:hypothetical protein